MVWNDPHEFSVASGTCVAIISHRKRKRATFTLIYNAAAHLHSVDEGYQIMRADSWSAWEFLWGKQLCILGSTDFYDYVTTDMSSNDAGLALVAHCKIKAETGYCKLQNANSCLKALCVQFCKSFPHLCPLGRSSVLVFHNLTTSLVYSLIY